MDVVFGLGDQQRVEQMYARAKPGSQGSDTIALWGQKCMKLYKEVPHIQNAATASPEIVFYNGLNDSQMSSQIKMWVDANLGYQRDPLVRLQRTITHAKELES